MNLLKLEMSMVRLKKRELKKQKKKVIVPQF